MCAVFVRAFDPMIDTPYVPLWKWDEFLREPFDRHFELDLIEKNINCPGPAFTRVAVSEAVLRGEDNSLAEISDWYARVREVFIIVDAQPNLDMQPEDYGEDDDMRLQRRWDIESSALGVKLFWNNDHGEFKWANREDLGDKGLCKLIEEASNGVGEKLVGYGRRRFEVRPVFAVRK